MENLITVVFGMSKQGKTYLLNQRTKTETRVIYLDPMKQFFDGLIFRSANELLQYFEDRNPETFRVICRFTEESAEYEETETILQLAKKLKNVVLVIDEVDKISREGNVSKTLWQLFNYYRHYGISILCCARRPARVSRDLTGNADEIVCFKVQEPNDIKYLNEFNFNGDNLRALPKYEFISNNG